MITCFLKRGGSAHTSLLQSSFALAQCGQGLRITHKDLSPTREGGCLITSLRQPLFVSEPRAVLTFRSSVSSLFLISVLIYLRIRPQERVQKGRVVN